MNYDGLISIPAWLRYNKMVKSFATLANIIADDDVRSDAILEWIEVRCKQIIMSKSSCGSNVDFTQIASDYGATGSKNVLRERVYQRNFIRRAHWN